MIAILYKKKYANPCQFELAAYYATALLDWSVMRGQLATSSDDEVPAEEQGARLAHVLDYLRHQERAVTGIPFAGDIIIVGGQAWQLLPFLDVRGSQRQLDIDEYAAACTCVERFVQRAQPQIYVATFECGHVSLVVASTPAYLAGYQLGGHQQCLECDRERTLTEFRPADQTERNEAVAIEREASQYLLEEERRHAGR